MTAPTPDTSPGDEVDEILTKFMDAACGYEGGLKVDLDGEFEVAKDRLNRLMLTWARTELEDVSSFVTEGTDTYGYIRMRIKAIDAQLNKEEKR